jgi:serine/threonine protein kinase
MIQVRARHKHDPALPDLKQNARVPDPFVGRVWALFDAALQFPASQRPDFVAAQCAGDVGLLSEVLSLLEYHSSVDRNESSQARTTSEDTVTEPQDSLPEFPGTARYVVRRRIGAGGFGVVYEVRDLARGSMVALKTLHNFTGESLFRFKREFRALADVTHPNLVQLYELGYEPHRWFFTMELVHGRRFLEHVWDRAIEPGTAGATRPFTFPPAVQEGVLPRLIDAMRQLVEGLDALHRSGHLHRDVKP